MEKATNLSLSFATMILTCRAAVNLRIDVLEYFFVYLKFQNLISCQYLKTIVLKWINLRFQWEFSKFKFINRFTSQNWSLWRLQSTRIVLTYSLWNNFNFNKSRFSTFKTSAVEIIFCFPNESYCLNTTSWLKYISY